jgi:hypothetical protein
VPDERPRPRLGDSIREARRPRVRRAGFRRGEVFEEKPRDFELAAEARILRGAQAAADVALPIGERLYFTWTLTGDRRIVHTVADEAGLEVLKKEEAERVDARLARDGLGSFVESVDAETVHLLIFSSAWSHANRLKPGHTVDLRATTATFTPTGEAIEAEILNQMEAQK